MREGEMSKYSAMARHTAQLARPSIGGSLTEMTNSVSFSFSTDSFLAFVLALTEILTFLSYFVTYRYTDCNFLRAGFNSRRNHRIFAGANSK